MGKELCRNVRSLLLSVDHVSETIIQFVDFLNMLAHNHWLTRLFKAGIFPALANGRALDASVSK